MVWFLIHPNPPSSFPTKANILKSSGILCPGMFNSHCGYTLGQNNNYSLDPCWSGLYPAVWLWFSHCLGTESLSLSAIPQALSPLGCESSFLCLHIIHRKFESYKCLSYTCGHWIYFFLTRIPGKGCWRKGLAIDQVW